MGKRHHKNMRQRLRTGMVAVLVALAIMTPAVRAVTSQELQGQIDSLNSQQAEDQSTVTHLRSQALSYEDEINRLQSQISQIEQQIAANQARQAELQEEITKTQSEVEIQRAILAEIVQTLYIDGNISTMEMLATSNTLSDYVDKQEYRISVQDKISVALAKIKKLEAQLKSQKAAIDALIEGQKTQQNELDMKRNEQTQMLAYNQQQQGEYNSRIRATNAQLSSLQSRMAALNGTGSRNISYAGSGGYPARWANAPQDSLIDDWGMYNRECVSYTAWKVAASGRNMPYWGGVGNAYQWIQNARSAGIPVDFQPRVGDVAIRDINRSVSGDVGHSMYVESVYQSGGQTWVRISQYNASYDGRYSEADRPAAGLYFIHF